MYKIFRIFFMWVMIFVLHCSDHFQNILDLQSPSVISEDLVDYMHKELPQYHCTARILVLDCKGGNAILATELLKSIEYITGQAIGKSFHMLYGMGSGVLPAARLSLYHTKYHNQIYTASDLSEFYRKYCFNFYSPFEESFCSSIFSCWRGPKYRYDTSILHDTVKASFHKLKMSQLSNDVIIPYWNYEEKRLVPVKSYDCRLYGHEDYYLKDLVTAAMSTPHFFNPFPLHRANYGMTDFSTKALSAEYIIPNLGLTALTEAYSLYYNADSYLLVSIGPDDFIKQDYASNKVLPMFYNESSSSFYAQLMHTGAVCRKKPLIRCHLRIPSSNFHQHMFQVDVLLKQHLLSVLEDTEVIEKINIISDFLKLPMVNSQKFQQGSAQPVNNHINTFFEVCPQKNHPVWRH